LRGLDEARHDLLLTPQALIAEIETKRMEDDLLVGLHRHSRKVIEVLPLYYDYAL